MFSMARDCSWTAQVTLLKKAAVMIGFRHACKISQQMLMCQPRSMSLYSLLSFQPLLHALPIPVQSCSNNLRMLLLSHQ